MSFNIGDVGEGVAGQAAGAILGIGLGAYNRNQQEIQARRLQGIQISGQKEMADYNMQKELEMWKNTSYGPQMEQMKKAGVNPALIYGMSGGGAQTTRNPSANVTGQQAAANPGEAQAMGIQGGMMAAQIELMKAEARNASADASNKEGVIPENIKSQTGLNLANTGNTIQDTELKKIETELKGIDAQVKGATIEEQIRIITQTATKLDEEVMQLGVKTNMDRATQQDKIDMIHAELAGVAIQNALMNSEIGKNEQQVTTMKQDILQKWKALSQEATKLNQKEKEIAIEKWSAQMKSAYPSIFGVAGNVLQTLTRLADKRAPTFEIPMPKDQYK